MNKSTNEQLANQIADKQGDLFELLGLARERLGDDSELYCVSSTTIIEFILSNRHSSLKIVWLREICSRLINLENKNAASYLMSAMKMRLSRSRMTVPSVEQRSLKLPRDSF